MTDRTATSNHGVEVVRAAAAPTLRSSKAGAFYTDALRELAKLQVPFLLAGTYAVSAYTGITRGTKDLDIFCKAGDFSRILAHFKALGYTIVIEDDRWLGKVFSDEHFFDVIFASPSGTMPVNDRWFEHTRQMEVFGTLVSLIAPTELVWSKAFIQLRHRYDGADIVNIILKQHDEIDWHRLLAYMDLHWEVLFTHILNFRWVYPSRRHFVPRWLMDELIGRLRRQVDLPLPLTDICRGRTFSRIDYEMAVKEWGFVDVGDDCELPDG